MGLTLLAAAASTADLTHLEQQVAAAKAVADQAVVDAAAADAAAANARQMVLNRDGTLATLSQTASQFGSVTAAADATHQQLQDEINALTAQLASVKTTPGPAGVAGEQGLRGPSGVDGVQGLAGPTGPAGTANLVIGIKPIALLALGGNTTLTIPWGRTPAVAPANVQFSHSSVVSLANVTFTNAVVTTTGVTVKVTSVGLALAAGTVVALGW